MNSLAELSLHFVHKHFVMTRYAINVCFHLNVFNILHIFENIYHLMPNEYDRIPNCKNVIVQEYIGMYE